jgi:hypothetical protein
MRDACLPLLWERVTIAPIVALGNNGYWTEGRANARRTPPPTGGNDPPIQASAAHVAVSPRECS